MRKVLLTPRIIAAHVSGWWTRYWFTSGGLISVAMVRIAIALAVLLSWRRAVPQDYGRYLESKPANLYSPDGVLKFFGDVLPSPVFFEAWKWVALVSTVFMLIGLFSRISTFVSLVSNLILVSLLSSFTPGWSHGYNVVFLAQIAFLFARSGDALSADAIMDAFRSKQRFSLDGKTQRSYSGAVLLAQWAVVLMFANAAFWKLQIDGYQFGWVFSDNLRHQLAVRYYGMGETPPAFVEWLMADQWRYKGFALGNIMSQLLPLGACIFVRRPILRFVFGSFFVVETLGLGIVMGLWDTHWLPLAAIFIDWDRCIPWTGSKLAAARRRLGVTVYYDGACGLCNRTMHIIRSLDWIRLVEYVDVPSLPDADLPLGVTRERLLDEMGVATSTSVRYGFAGHVRVFSRLPLTMIFVIPLSVLMWVPPVMSIGNVLYARIAHKRMLRSSGGGDRCAIDSGDGASGGTSVPTPSGRSGGVRWKGILATGYIVAFLGYYCFIAFSRDVRYEHNNYPFSAFMMYHGIRAKPPLDRHQSYEILASRIDVESPNQIPASMQERLDRVYRNLYKIKDVEELRSRLAKVLDYVSTKLSGVERLTLRDVVLQVPAYPADPEPIVLHSAFKARLDRSGAFRAVTGVYEKDRETRTAYLRIETAGYRDPKFRFAYILNNVEGPKELEGEAIGDRFYYKSIENGRHLFVVFVTDSSITSNEEHMCFIANVWHGPGPKWN
ncbi:MAG: DCC1-like thiol-disulfide oxidoreductase family protein [Phycisphaerales bacterium]